LNAEPGVIDSVATLTRYTLLALGIIFSLGILGLDFTSLAIIAGGLSVGIGIGLQDIVANFVSGLVLLFEQSLRPGDVVELDGRISQVEKISLRATTVRTRTNEELIIPNANFTTQQVKNLTKSDRLVLVRIPLGVSYKSDPELIRQLAIETGLQHPLVLAEPAPKLLFLEYGESSLDFVLLVGVNRPELTVSIRSDIYYMLWKVFKEHKIEIPFPQRDLNLGEGWEKIATDLQAT
jgi:small-conductance mechanosensitive channel